MERIKWAAIKTNKKIYTCKRHYECFRKIALNEDSYPKENCQGFITEEGRFVGREEAMQIALEAGQVKKGGTIRDDILFSEDLY